MLSEAILATYVNWVRSVKKNLVSVRGGQGSQLAEQLDELGEPDNLVRALNHVTEIPKLIEKFSLSGRWKRKVTNKCEVWKKAIVCALSRTGVRGEVAQEMLVAGEVVLEDVLDYAEPV